MEKRNYIVGDIVFIKETNEVGVISQINKGIASKKSLVKQDDSFGFLTGAVQSAEPEYIEVFSVNVGESLPRLIFDEDDFILIRNRDILRDILNKNTNYKESTSYDKETREVV